MEAGRYEEHAVQPLIVTVLRSGGEYKPEHVLRLHRQCRQFAPRTPFAVLTDVEIPNVANIRLQNGWPGWWSKMEAFDLDGPIFYLDLDTSIVGDLTPILRAACEHSFIALRNPMKNPSRFGSGLMAWGGNMRHVLQRFSLDPERHMARCTTQKLWGDQGFIGETETPDAYWQDLFPGQILSWKVECDNAIPPDARIVYFHGKPRPWDVGM